MRPAVTLLIVLFSVVQLSCGSKQSKKPAEATQSNAAPSASEALKPAPANSAPQPYTDIVARNVILKEHSSIDIRIRWLRGRMYRTHSDLVPSFDDRDSFYIEVQDGAISASLADVSKLLNSGILKGSPLEKVKLSKYGKQVKLNGILQKGIPLPIEVVGDVSASSDGSHVQIHMAKLNVLKIPVKGLLNTLHIKTADLFDPKGVKGIQVKGDDVYVDAAEILPPPRNRGKLTDVHVAKNGDLVEIYGNTRAEVPRVEQLRNFIRLRGGTVELGKLTMQNADILIADTSQGQWFEFAPGRYEEQLVNGYALITPQAGLQIFVPNFSKIAKNAANQKISIEWMKDRKIPPPAGATP